MVKVIQEGETIYYRPPTLYSVTPSNVQKLSDWNPKHVVAYYTEDLELIDSTKSLSIEIEAKDGQNQQDKTAIERSSTSNIIFDSKVDPRKIEFDFTPSSHYGGDLLIYTFNFKNIQGVISKKAPYSFGYFVKYENTFACPKKYGDARYLYGKMSLLDDTDILKETLTDGNTLSQSGIDFRFALVASKPIGTTSNNLENKLTDDGDKIQSAYSVSMNLCEGEKNN